MQALLIALALAACGVLDRVRGGFPKGRPRWIAHVATAAAYGLMAAILTSNRYLIAAGVVAGELAWRHDAGWRGDWVRGKGRWWQPMRWGSLWGIPLGCMGVIDHTLLVYPIAAPLGALVAAHVAVRLPPTDPLQLYSPWAWSELLQLPIIGALAVTLAALVERLG